MQPSVNDRERQRTIVTYEQHSGHIEQQINLPRDVCELGARVMVLLQVEGEEQIGLVVSVIITGIKKRTLRTGIAHLVIRNLKQEFD